MEKYTVPVSSMEVHKVKRKKRGKNADFRKVPLNEMTAAQMRNYLKNMVDSKIGQELEKKYFDTFTNSGSNLDWTGLVPISLTDIPQGSSDTSRDGDKIQVTSLEWSFFFKYNGSGTLSSTENVVRLLIFAWKPFVSDVAPTVGKVLTYTGTYYSAEGPLTHDGRGQFVILLDTCFVLNGINAANMLVKQKLKYSHAIQYKAGSTTNASGGIFFLAISDAQAGVGPYPSLGSYIVRVNFTDA